MAYKFSCPGSEKKEIPKPEYIPCPQCGVEVEVWSDEPQGECDECGSPVKIKTG